MVGLAIAATTWLLAAAGGLLFLGILIRVTLGLIARLKDLNRTLAGAQGEIAAALADINAEMERVSEGLTGIRERRGGQEHR